MVVVAVVLTAVAVEAVASMAAAEAAVFTVVLQVAVAIRQELLHVEAATLPHAATIAALARAVMLRADKAITDTIVVVM